MLHILLADGFEEIEALATLDILRRLQLPVQTVSIKGARQVCGAHGLMMKADCLLRKNELRQSEGIILPGGLFKFSAEMLRCFKAASQSNFFYGQICKLQKLFSYR